MRDPWIAGPFVALIAIALVYLRGACTLWRRAGRGHGARPVEAAAFAAGTASMIVAATPRLHEAAERTLPAHMAQHLLLMVIAPPLLIFARPFPVLLFALPPNARVRLGKPLGRAGRLALSTPGLALAAILNAGAFWAWHAPFAYDAAVRHESLHILEHASLLSTSLLLWWTILEAPPYDTRASVLAMASAMAAGLQGAILGLLMLASTSTWYTAYGDDPTALSRQETAGALMWGGTGGAYVLAVAVLLWRLLDRADQANPQPYETSA
jgi:putative membrane protein